MPPSLITKANIVEKKVILLEDDCLSFFRNVDGTFDVEVNFAFEADFVLNSSCRRAKIQILELPRESVDKDVRKLINSKSILDVKRAKLLLKSGYGKYNFVPILNGEVDLFSALDNTRLKVPYLNSRTFTSFKDSGLVIEQDEIVIKNPLTQKFLNKSNTPLQINDVFDKSVRMESTPNTFDVNSQKYEAGIINESNKPIDNLFTSKVFSKIREKTPIKNELLPTIDKEITPFIKIKKRFKLLQQYLSLGRFIVYVDLYNKLNSKVYSQNKTIFFEDILASEATPKASPVVTAKKINKNGSDFLCVAVSHVRNDSQKFDSALLKVGDSPNSRISLQRKKEIFTIQSPLISNKVIASVSYEGEGTFGTDFTSSFVKSKNFDKYGFITATQLKNYTFSLTAKTKNSKAISVIFYCTDLTLRSRPTKISNQIKLNSGIALIPSPKMLQNHIYEFFAIFYTDNGCQFRSKGDIVECYSIMDPQIYSNISEVSSNNDDVTFKIDINVPQKPTDVILNFLRERDLESYFTQKTEDQITQLKNFTAYKIFRINLENGHRENLGTFSGNSFSDKNISDNLFVPVRSLENSYEYQVFPTLVDINTVYDRQINRDYPNSFIESHLTNYTKFNHVMVKKNSMLLTPEGLKKKFSRSIMDFNILGAPSSVTVGPSRKQVSTKITNFVAERITQSHHKEVKLSWEIGNTNLIDYLLLLRSSNIGSQIIGKVLPECTKYYDRPSEMGEMIYALSPVYKTGVIGEKIISKITVRD